MRGLDPCEKHMYYVSCLWGLHARGCGGQESAVGLVVQHPTLQHATLAREKRIDLW